MFQTKIVRKILIAYVFVLLFQGISLSHEDILHYGDVKIIVPNPYTEGTNPAFPDQKGYVAGTNVYDDTGKYQRFDFYSSNYVIGAVVYFGYKEIDTSGIADTINIVLRDMSNNSLNGVYGPGEEILASSTVTLDQMDTTGAGNYILFDTPVQMGGDDFFADSFFIGIEWQLTDHLDTFALFSDSTGGGLGDGANRAWEKFNDESYNDFGCVVNPSYCWDYDIDLWIGVVHTDELFSKEPQVLYPGSIKLNSVYPNPFNPSTTISFEIDRSEDLEISIYDLMGKRVRDLSKANFNAGNHYIKWNGKSNDFRFLTSGTYIVEIRSEKFSLTKKIILLK